MTRSVLIAAVFAFAALPVRAQDAANEPEAAEAPVHEVTDFIRVDENERAARLQTAVTRYEKEGLAVDLIGAVHVADKKYYEALNKSFEQYDVILFELIGGENLVDGKIPAGGEEDDLQAKLLRQLVNGMARYLHLSTQMAEIDYSPKNFVHADLTLKQFAKKQDEKGESILGFALAAAQNAENQGLAQPDPAKLLAALLSGNSDGIKLEMIKTLGHGDDQIAALAGNNVIVGDRNKKCFKVLKRQIKQGHKRIGIFYGAAHFPDMERRLLKQGYEQTRQEWMTAWDVPKPAAKPKEQPRDEDGAEQKKAA